MDVNKCKLKHFMTSFIIALLISFVIFMPIFLKPAIHNITYDELLDIQGVSDVKAELMLSYIKANKDVVADDLIGICGVGDVLIERIKKDFR